MLRLSPLSRLFLMNVLSISANTESGACLDVRAQGFWGVHHQLAYLDVRVFDSLTATNRQSTLSTCFRSHDCEKCQVYEQQVHAPLLYSQPLVE